MKNILKTSCLMLVAGLIPVAAHAEMQSISYADLSQITGQAISIDLGKDKSKGLSFAMDPTGGSLSKGPSKTKYRDVSYTNETSGAGFVYGGGRTKGHGFSLSWTTPPAP
ncbi:MAG: DUF6160 family protein [Candidatus Macondimonas sp.]|jgi:hypothetical protein